MGESNFQQLIDKLVDGRDLSVNNFSGSYDSNNTKYSHYADLLWEKLLNHIYNGIYNSDSERESHKGIRENDFPLNKESLIEFINNKIDLDKDLLDKNKSIDFFNLYIKDREKGQHWNESLSKLVDYYYNLFYTDILDDQQIDNSQFVYRDFKNIDAGYNFNNEPFVSPDKNGDKINNELSTYEKIRGKDKILRALKNMSNLQFTADKQMNNQEEEKINQYLRLIMPEYKREVQVEDLNRNFWVIGQALTALFSFLFDDTSVYPELLSALLDEIVQLWENIFYLWICVSVISEKTPYEDIKILFLPVSNSNYNLEQSQIKNDSIDFDNFVDKQYKTYNYYLASEDEIDNPDKKIERENNSRNFNKNVLINIWENNLYYIKNKYDNCGLIIIPEIRDINYTNNYYAKAIYPGIIIYDDSVSDEVIYKPFLYPIMVNVKEQKIHYMEESFSPEPIPPEPTPPEPEPPSPGFEWDETKIGVLLLDENLEPTNPPNVLYYDTWQEAKESPNIEYPGYWIHQGRLMNPIPELPESIFSWHYYLTFIDLYQQTVIPNNCFNNAEYGNQLKRITGLNSITRIEDYGLFYCWSLENLTIPENVSYIGEGAFGYTPIAVANIPSGITEIKDYTFEWCQNLTDISIPNSVMSIGNCAFQGCVFTSITLPNSIITIGSGAFSHCENLESIIIPNSVTSLGDEVFYDCHALTSITLSNNLTSIEPLTFAYCSSLSSITIPNSVISIDDQAFAECAALTTITVNKPANSISGAPWGATNATVIWTG